MPRAPRWFTLAQLPMIVAAATAVATTLCHDARAGTFELAGPVAPEEVGVTRFTLPNGISVILREITGCPNVALVTLFDVGEAHDPPGKSGMARIVNRLYVSAASGDIPARSTVDWVNAYPAPEMANAYVGEDFSVVATVFNSEKFDDELREVASRLTSVKPVNSDLERERFSVLDAHYALNDNLPPSVGYLTVREMIHPSADGARLGGVKEQIQGITLEDVNAALTSYCPRNTTIVAVGGIDTASARTLITNLLGSIPSGEPVARPSGVAAGAQRLGEKEVVVVKTDKVDWQGHTIVMLGFEPPPPGDPLYPAFQVMVGYLYRATMARAMSQPPEGSSLLGIEVMYRTVEDNAILQVAGMMVDGGDQDAALDELRAFAKRAASGSDLTDEVDVETAGLVFSQFGLGDPNDGQICDNPYPAAFGSGRMRQMGYGSGGELVRSFNDVTKADLRACFERVMRPGRDVSVVIEAVPRVPGE